MDACDVLIVGGGPAGSTCAGILEQAGLDVLLMDREAFPRLKPCAGWITPAVLDTLAIDADEYRTGRVLQEISAFRVGQVHGPEVLTSYGRVVSYGILRSEFDHFLLQRTAARKLLGEAVERLERKGMWWVVNGRIRSRLVVGAGGHFCPVARLLGAKIGREAVIAAQVAEIALRPDQEQDCRTAPDTPELYFCRDMKGYGWLFRKGNFLNIGLGRRDTRNLGGHLRNFCTFLRQRGIMTLDIAGSFRGHAYRLYGRRGGRTCLGDGALLIGDAAGLSQPQSGEGILTAVESALIASDIILEAAGDYRRDNLELYTSRLADRFVDGSGNSALFSGLVRRIGAQLLSNRWFVRHVVLDRWFLHAHQNLLVSK